MIRLLWPRFCNKLIGKVIHHFRLDNIRNKPTRRNCELVFVHTPLHVNYTKKIGVVVDTAYIQIATFEFFATMKCDSVVEDITGPQKRTRYLMDALFYLLLIIYFVFHLLFLSVAYLISSSSSSFSFLHFLRNCPVPRQCWG